MASVLHSLASIEHRQKGGKKKQKQNLHIDQPRSGKEEKTINVVTPPPIRLWAAGWEHIGTHTHYHHPSPVPFNEL